MKREVLPTVSSIKVSKLKDGAIGVIYIWSSMDDDASGHVLVDEVGEVIYPSTEAGIPLGSMFVARSVGDVENPDPVTREIFTKVAAAIFGEWRKQGHLPDAISRSFW